MHEALQRFQMAKLKPFEERALRELSPLGSALTQHLNQLLQMANMKYATWHDRKVRMNSKLLTPSVTIDSVDFESNPPSLVPHSPSVSVFTERSSLTTPGADGGQDGAQVELLKGPPRFGEATRSYVQSRRHHAWRATFQGQVYNFLERPSGWKCIIYHVLV
ncbi:hypothetical protein HA402_011330 [Bradysia odoriphaga]|nr:hypothetical protein HA402_011330 [Bradysia odoriphaga]